jgi:hypothetical protein
MANRDKRFAEIFKVWTINQRNLVKRVTAEVFNDEEEDYEPRKISLEGEEINEDEDESSSTPPLPSSASFSSVPQAASVSAGRKALSTSAPILSSQLDEADDTELDEAGKGAKLARTVSTQNPAQNSGSSSSSSSSTSLSIPSGSIGASILGGWKADSPRQLRTSESIWGQFLHEPLVAPDNPASQLHQQRCQFSKRYLRLQQRQEQRWQRYVALNGAGVSMARSADFLPLVRSGIPDSLRGRIWVFSSGALWKACVEPGLYQRVSPCHMYFFLSLFFAFH